MHVNRLEFSNSEGFVWDRRICIVSYCIVLVWIGLCRIILHCQYHIISYWFSYVWFRVVCFVLYFIMYWFAGIIILKLIISVLQSL